MPMVSEMFPSSKWLKCADLKGHEVEVLIDRVELQEFDNGVKPAAFFRDKDKAMVLNLTNTKKIASAYGDDTDDWTGQSIILYPDTTEFNGKTVDCIRVRVPAPTVSLGDDDSIPF